MRSWSIISVSAKQEFVAMRSWSVISVSAKQEFVAMRSCCVILCTSFLCGTVDAEFRSTSRMKDTEMKIMEEASLHVGPKFWQFRRLEREVDYE
jgi:hypothetical protein